MEFHILGGAGWMVSYFATLDVSVSKCMNLLRYVSMSQLDRKSAVHTTNLFDR